ncbi:hypothetical protein M407DRAFT_19872 [Tulasnella calospora MUT 4182]|uniref:Phospholipid scramblase n=1 Tax=Tulasnella calospora MUT 4182 TaxID=1051891 RepID=A0A0C3QSJ9_9AGAM|nr:hypothetical protein M407DRAFT_19872 [Tulasnella calospora MUT 4182]
MLPIRPTVQLLRQPGLLSRSCRTLPSTASLIHRSYALSRYPERGSRLQDSEPTSTISRPGSSPQPIYPASSETIQQNELLMEDNPDFGGLEKLLANDMLVVTRQIEMLNILMGFAVANRYAINDVHGNVLGYIAEEERGFFGTLARHNFMTHRRFRSVIMDVNGTPILWIHRPLFWINSRLFVQRKLSDSEVNEKTGEEESSLFNFGVARQEWHPWRRKYHLSLGQPEQGELRQFAQIDSGVLAWDFFLQNERNVNIGSIRKGWTGLGRDIFTDRSPYTIRFTPDPQAPSTPLAEDGTPILPQVFQPLSLEERALVLASTTTPDIQRVLDVDYNQSHGWK